MASRGVLCSSVSHGLVEGKRERERGREEERKRERERANRETEEERGEARRITCAPVSPPLFQRIFRSEYRDRQLGCEEGGRQ